MKYCSKCGTPAEDNQNFCLNCGSRLTAPIAQQEAQGAAAAAAAAATAQGQLAAQQQQAAAAAQTVQDQLAANQTAAAATQAQDQLAAQQQQAAAAAQTVQDQLAANQAAAAAAAATAAAQQQAAAQQAAQVAATAEAQQAAQAAAAQAKSEAEARAKEEALKAAQVAQAAVPQAVQQAAPAAQPFVSVAPDASGADGEKKKGGMGKWFAIIGFALVAVVLVIILLINVFGSSYRTPIKKLVSAMNSKSTDSSDYFACYPKAVEKLYNDTIKTTKEGFTLLGKEEYVKILNNMDLGLAMSSSFDQHENKVGKNLKYSYSIQDKKELDPTVLAGISRQYQKIATDLKAKIDSLSTGESSTKKLLVSNGAKAKDANDYCDKVVAVLTSAYKSFAEIDAQAITDGYDVTLRLDYKGDKDEDYTTDTVRVLKINGKWVLDLTSDDSLVSEKMLNELIKMMMLKF